MAFQINCIEGFDQYTNDGDLSTGFTIVNPSSYALLAGYGGREGRGVIAQEASSGFSKQLLSGPYTSIQVGMAFILDVGGEIDPGLSCCLMQFSDSSYHTMLSIVYNSNGTISLYTGGTNFLNGTLIAGPFNFGGRLPSSSNAAWFYLEAQVYFSSTGGQVALSMSTASTTTSVLLTGLNTAPSGTAGTCEFVTFGITGYALVMDDLYIGSGWYGSNTLGSGFLGDCRVLTNLPSSDGTYLQWSFFGLNGASGSTTLALNGLNPSANDVGLYSNTVGQTSTCHVAAPTFTGNAQAVSVAFEGSSTSATALVKPVYIDNAGGVHYGTGWGVDAASGVYTQRDTIFSVDPNTGSPWTQSALTGAQFGVELSST